MATDLGKVGMRAIGDWSNSATYEVLDVVSYQNGLYVAKQAVPANTVPTNTTYWQNAVSYSDIFTKVPAMIVNTQWKHQVSFDAGTYGCIFAIMANKAYIIFIYVDGNTGKAPISSTAQATDIDVTCTKSGNTYSVTVAFAGTTSNSINLIPMYPINYASIVWA